MGYAGQMTRTHASAIPRRRVWAAAAGLVAAPLAAFSLGGCSASTEEAAAANAAASFAATSTGDPQTACGLLAQRTRDELERTAEQPCDEALPDENLPASTAVTRTDLAGLSARVDLEGQTVFLARFDSGWKVVAAGCSKEFDEPNTPYTCQVQGS